MPTSILPREARFAYVASTFRLAEIYVSFVVGTDARQDRPMDAVGRAKRCSGRAPVAGIDCSCLARRVVQG